MNMNRRDALSRVAILMGGAVIGGELFLTGCKAKARGTLGLTDADISLLDEIGEAIIPTTNTPGAKAVQIGSFMEMIVTNCYTERDQKVFVEGLKTFQQKTGELLKKSFLDANADERKAFVTKLNEEQVNWQKTKKDDEPVHYFRMMKELTLLGYFSSEIGIKSQLRYNETPGKYVGDMPYKKGEHSFI